VIKKKFGIDQIAIVPAREKINVPDIATIYNSPEKKNLPAWIKKILSKLSIFVSL
jgi:hypothetical protein